MRNIFVDTSALCAALDEQDAGHALARAALGTDDPKVTTDHVLVVLWHLVQRRFGLREANGTFEQLMVSSTEVEPVGVADLYVALDIGTEFPDHGFSLVDRTSLAVMRRLGISRSRRSTTTSRTTALALGGAGRSRSRVEIRDHGVATPSAST